MSEFLRTQEIRWFGPGSLPCDIPLLQEGKREERTDAYLKGSGPDCGVKWREGRLECKLRLDRPCAVTCGGIAGTASTWGKWGAEGSPEVSPCDSPWIAVRKNRVLRIIEHSDGSKTQLESGNAKVGEDLWWTVCLEACGPASEKALIHTLANLADSADLADWLNEDASLSYPQWLMRIDPPLD